MNKGFPFYDASGLLEQSLHEGNSEYQHGKLMVMLVGSKHQTAKDRSEF